MGENLAREAHDKAFATLRYASACNAVAQLAQSVGGLKGRKNLLWISSEFPPVTEPVAGEFGAALVDMSRALDAANVAVYPVEVRSPVPPVPFLPVAPGSEASLPASRKREIVEQGRKNAVDRHHNRWPGSG